MILLNVSQLLKDPHGATRDIEFADPSPELADELHLAAAIEGSAHLLRTRRGILASVRYHTAVQQICSRCLTPFILEIEGSPEDEFMPSVDVVTGAVLPVQAESEELIIDEHHLLNLSEVIRQDTLTRLPIQPLCAPDCPGLCPQCGRELRTGACSCSRTAAEGSPFAELARWFRDEGSTDVSST